MKKSAIAPVIAGILLLSATGCLKDKGFDNGQYGLNVSENKGVAFPNANKSPQSFGLNVSASPQVVDGLLAVTLEIVGVAEADITVSLSNTTGTASAGDVKAYNDANGTSVEIFPSSLYIIPATVTIPAGQKLIKFPVTVSNTLSLNPNLSYGVGITISSASNGYQVAANMNKMLVIFNVKNKYDGHYRLRGFHNRVPYEAPYDVEVDMETTGPSSVTMYWPDLGNYGHPIAGGTGFYTNFTTNFIFDPATDLMTGWSLYPYPNGTTTCQVDASSRYEAATKSMFLYYWYNNNPAARAFKDTLTYIGPR